MQIRRLITAIVLVGIIGILFITGTTRSVLALSIDDYFTYTYSFAFSKTNIVGSETFIVTVSGQAICVQDLPLPVSTASIVSKVVARHKQTGTEVVLNPNYSINYDSGFPSQKGQTASASAQVSLSFPNGSPAGVYDITGQILEAKVSVLVITIDVAGYLPSTQLMGTVTYSPSSTGGGGGSTVTPGKSESITDLSSLVSATGELLTDAEAKSRDGMVTLKIPKGTRFTVQDAAGSIIVMREIEKGKEPGTPEGQFIVGKAYNLGPEGANFSPPAQLVLSFDPALIPIGAQKKSLVIAWWDTASAKWVPLKDCNVDEAANTVTGAVDHFTIFTLIANQPSNTITTPPTSSTPEPVMPSSTPPTTITPPSTLSPASFMLSDLEVTPTVVTSGKRITVTVLLSNTGDLAGIYEAVMKLDGQIVNSQSIELAGKSSRLVTFTHLASIEGQHIVAIGDLSKEFTVKAPQITGETLKWWLIGGLAGLGLGLVIGYSIIRASRRKKDSG